MTVPSSPASPDTRGLSESDISELLTVRQAIDVIDSEPVFPRVDRRPLGEAQGLRLAEDIVSDRDYPPFDKSLMDGYAVRAADVAGATPDAPAVLRVVGEVAAGQWPQRAVGAGEAIAIMTGAPMPDGADGVVPVEETEETAVGLEVRRGDNPGRFVAKRGSDVAAGQVVLARGAMLEAGQLAVAASVGAAEVAVHARPRVAVLGTGDELVPVGKTPGPAQIRNSNNVMLVALLRRLGCDVTDLGIARDNPDAVREGLTRGLIYDALFVTGGMSMGAYDYVPRTLVELGVTFKVTKLRVKPGKPFVFGRRGDACVARVPAPVGATPAPPAAPDAVNESVGATPASPGYAAGQSPPETGDAGLAPTDVDPTTSGVRATQASPLHSFVFGLPGNPVSAFVCSLRLASRLLTRMAGGAVEERWLTGRLDAGLPANGPREFYLPVVRSAPPGPNSAHSELAAVRPLAWKGSADLYTLAAANALLVRAENEPPVARGTLVRVLEIP